MHLSAPTPREPPILYRPIEHSCRAARVGQPGVGLHRRGTVSRSGGIFRQSPGPRFVETSWRETKLVDRLTMHHTVVVRCVWSDDLSRSMDSARRRDEKHRRRSAGRTDSESAETAELSSRPKSRGSKGAKRGANNGAA